MRTLFWVALGAGALYLLTRKSTSPTDVYASGQSEIFKTETYMKLQNQGAENIIIQEPFVTQVNGQTRLCADYSSSLGSGTECKTLA